MVRAPGTGAGFSVVQAVRDGISLLPRFWAGAWLILLILLGTTLAQPVLILQCRAYGGLLCLGVALLGGLSAFIASSALYRIAIFRTYAHPEGLGFGGVQFGRPEIRLIIASLANGAFLLGVALAMGLVLVIGISAFGLEHGYLSDLEAIRARLTHPVSLVDYGLCVYLGLCAFILVILCIRLSLYKAATVARHQIVAVNALTLGAGLVWRLFCGSVIILLPLILLSVVVTGQSLAGAAGQVHGPLDVLNFHTRPELTALIIIQVLTVFFVKPAMVGYLSSAYRQLTDAH